MVFSSPLFLFVFLPFVLLVYYSSGVRARNPILLAASLIFYAWGEPAHVSVMIGSILMNWIVGMAMARSASRQREFAVLSIGVALNLCGLFYFKYTNFVFAQFSHLAGLDLPAPHFVQAIVLPIGISFFTFHAISYLVDIYRRQSSALTNPLTIGLYISMFPQLVAGPIIRYHDVAESLARRRHTLERFSSGIERFVHGLGKKVLIANVAGQVADAAFSSPPENLGAMAAWTGLVCYTLQIYFDFSGYSDMAIGLGRMFGFEFAENFNYPYVAASVREFWRRWHMSLSAWFRDYVYIPLGGNRGSSFRTSVNLGTVFLLCGLWHGASYTFVIWGLLHGALLIGERGRFGAALDAAPRVYGHIYTMAMVMVGWIFFRADTLSQAVTYMGSLLGRTSRIGSVGTVVPMLDPRTVLTLAVGIVLSTPAVAFMARDWRMRRFPTAGGDPPWGPMARMAERHDGTILMGLRALAVVAILLAAAANLAESTYNPFIYYRF